MQWVQACWRMPRSLVVVLSRTLANQTSQVPFKVHKAVALETST